MGKITNEKVHIVYIGSVFIKGEIECLTGLLIGGSDDSLKIGGIDKFVIKNPKDNKPYIPGSSLKGKMRSLLEKKCSKPINRSGGEDVFRHEDDNINDAIKCEVCRIFGATSAKTGALNLPARLTVRDTSMKDGGKLERKSENTLDRISAHANPRTNERVARGSKFPLDLKYDVEVILDESGKVLLGNNSEDSIEGFWDLVSADLKNILDVLLLIEYSALGGNGSRGYGKVKFNDVQLDAKTVQEFLGKKAVPIIGDSAPGKDSNSGLEVGEREDKFIEQRNGIPELIERFKATYEHIRDSLTFKEEECPAMEKESPTPREE